MSASAFLRDVIAELKASGAVKGRVEFDGSAVKAVELEFPAAPKSAAPFVGADGKPVDLDDGLPPLAKDPDEPPPVQLESSDSAIERANFKPKGNGKAAT
jgi:hypothetical protein